MFLNYVIPLFFIINLSQGEKEFVRNYDKRGNLASEGWVQDETKTDFWTFYHPNGTISRKGHYNNGKKCGYWYFYTHNNTLEKEGGYVNDMAHDWWILYNQDGMIKVQYKQGLKDGFALVYHNNRLKKAIRYDANKKTGEWTSYVEFKKDNPDVKF